MSELDTFASELDDNSLCTTIDDFDDVIAASSDKMQYPALELIGVKTVVEFDFFTSLCSKQDNNTLPIYIVVDQMRKRIGSLSPTLDNLLLIRSIYPYTLWLYKSEQEKYLIDLNDANSLIKFISIS